MNGWMYLVIAGIAEVFYAASMLRTEGFTVSVQQEPY